MSHTHEELSALALPQLKEIAYKLKIKVHHKAGAENIIAQIMKQGVAHQADAMKHVAERPAPAVFDNTPEEVLEAIKPFMKEGFAVDFPADGTWHFKYKGREESGNLQIPLRVIRNKAENVSRGALKLKMMNFDGELVIAG